MCDQDPRRVKLPKCNLLEKTVALAQAKGITFGEARRELGRRGAAARARKNVLIKNHDHFLKRKGLQ